MEKPVKKIFLSYFLLLIFVLFSLYLYSCGTAKVKTLRGTITIQNLLTEDIVLTDIEWNGKQIPMDGDNLSKGEKASRTFIYDHVYIHETNADVYDDANREFIFDQSDYLHFKIKGNLGNAILHTGEQYTLSSSMATDIKIEIRDTTVVVDPTKEEE